MIDEKHISISSDPEREDTNNFSLDTLEWMRGEEAFLFNKIDFIHVSDKILSSLFVKKDLIVTFYLCVKYTAKDIKEFVRDGIQRCNKSLVKKWENDSAQRILDSMHKDAAQLVLITYRFMGLTKTLISLLAGESKDKNMKAVFYVDLIGCVWTR